MAVAAGNMETQFCALCEEEFTNNPAVTWCTECETFLCSDCERHHGRSRASKEHNTIPAENYNELPDFITSTSPRCKKHGKRFELYCSFHQVACCNECTTKDHNECIEVREPTDVLKDFKASSHVAHMEDDLRDMQNDFEKITKYLKSRLGEIDAKKTKGVKQIKDLRSSINDHLDKLEQRLRDDLDDKHNKIKTAIENLLKDIESKKTQTCQLETDFDKMNKFATELQTFVGITEIERMTNEMVDYLIGITRKDIVEKKDVEIEKFSEILEVQSLGNVNFMTVPASLSLMLHQETQTRMQVPKNVDIDQIKPKLLKKIYLGRNGKGGITGCQILPTGQMLFVNQAGRRLMLFSEDGSFVQIFVTFTGIPYDVTYIKDNTVAVTTYDEKKVHFVEFERNIIVKSTNMSTRCFGIDSDGEVIRINCTDKQKIITRLDIDGKLKFSSRIITSNSSDIATFGENIYIPEYNEDRVKCLSKNGDVLWTYQLTEGKHPRGISVERHGFVYVT